jgi:hypothetical protein
MAKLVLLLTLITVACAYEFDVPFRQQKCMRVDVDLHQSLTGEYTVKGDSNVFQMMMTIHGPSHEERFRKDDATYGTFGLTANEDGES